MTLYPEKNRSIWIGIEPLWLFDIGKFAVSVSHELTSPGCAQGIYRACWVGLAAGVANEGSRKTGWKMAGFLNRAAWGITGTDLSGVKRQELHM